MSRTADPESPAKKKLLDAAERLILEKSFNATTVDDICASAGLTKGSFFHYFGNKEDLGKAVLDHHMAKRRKSAETAAYLRLADPLERVYGGIDFISRTSREAFQAAGSRGGCLIGDLAQELAYTNPAIRSRCAECLSQVAQEIEGDLAAAKAKYAAKSALDPRELAEHFVAIMEGSLVLAKAQQDAEPIEKNLAHFKEYIRFLFKR